MDGSMTDVPDEKPNGEFFGRPSNQWRDGCWRGVADTTSDAAKAAVSAHGDVREHCPDLIDLRREHGTIVAKFVQA